MSGYDSIPPERQAAYLQNAQEAIESAAQPVVDPAVEALGELVVKDAESLTRAQDSIGDQATKYLKAQMDEITGEKPDSPTEIAEKPGKFMTTRREYSSSTPGRVDLGGTGFGEVHKLTGQIGLKNQLWTKMTEQNKQDPEKPQAPSS